MRLSIEKRFRIIVIFHKHELHFERYKFEKLSNLAQDEDIFISANGARNIVKKWQKTGSIIDLQNESNGTKHTKISNRDIIRLDNAIYKRRDMTAPKLKEQLRQQAGIRSIQRYIRRLGWRKVNFFSD